MCRLCLLILLFGASSCWAQSNPFEEKLNEELFQQGLTNIYNGNFERGAELLEVLYLRTKAIRVKLELARCYYLVGQKDKAEQYFQDVLSENPPFMVRERVGGFLDDIKVSNGKFDFAIGFISDTNPRAITSDRSVNIQGNTYSYNPGFDTSAKYGASYFLSASKGLDEKNKLIIGLNANGAKFEGSAFDRTDIEPFISYRLIDLPKLQIRAGYENNWFGGQKLFESPNFSIKNSYELLDGSFFSGELKTANLTYPDYDYLSGPLSSFSISSGKVVTNNLMIGIEGSMDRQKATENPYSYRTQSGGIFINYLFPEFSLKTQAKLTYSNRDFDADDPIFGFARNDVKKGVYITLIKTDIKVFGLSPMLELGIENNDSNINIYSYSRYITNLSFKKVY